MQSTRWDTIEKVFNEALQVPASERSALVKEACGSDADLHAEVVSLLKADSHSDAILEQSVFPLVANLLDDDFDGLLEKSDFASYKLKRLLGKGGMGAVFLAEDTRLSRLVALKVLPPALAKDEKSISRFKREARAASSISHSNVAHIYEFGEVDGRLFLAMEYVEGRTVRQLIREKAVPPSLALNIAKQTALALESTHRLGIIHRDIKPENIMIRSDGLVKVLDFGLARIIESELYPKARPLAADTNETLPGMIMGTVGYMSPEQVRCLQTDTRTDIWSLGVVLYEMLAGERPFTGDSRIDTLNAVLKEQPSLLDGPQTAFQPIFAGILRRCLAKERIDRFQTAADLAFAVESLVPLSAPFDARALAIGRQLSNPSRIRWQRRAAVPLGALFALLAYLAIFHSNGLFGASDPSQTTYRQLTFQRGTIWSARFTPDGNSLIYNATWNGGGLDLFSLRPPNTEGRALDLLGRSLLSVSSKGDLAILRNEKYLYQFIHRGTLERMPIDGGGARDVAENVQDADWSPDGENLAIVRWSDGRNRLEYPIGNVLYDTEGYISYPRVSPDGRRIAFHEHATQWDNRGYVSVVDGDGAKQTLSGEWSGLEGLAWRGDQVWFTASRQGEAYALYAVRPGEAERMVQNVPANLLLHDIARDGRVLLSRAIQQTDVFLKKRQLPQQDLSWLHLVGISDFSADGSTILFTHFGEGSGTNYSVYLRKTDGSPAVKLGEGRALALSQDGRYAVAKINVPEGLVLLPAKAGETISLPKGDIEHFDRAGWMPDGVIIFTGNEKGKPKRTFVQYPATGEIRPLTPEGLSGTQVSPGGEQLIVGDGHGGKMLFSIANGETLPIYGLDPNEEIIRWHADGESLLVFRPLELPLKIYRLRLSDGRRELVREITPSSAAGVIGNIYLFATPDANSFVFGLRRYLFDLYLAEGLQ